nr:MAG TPA: hypothetical protein [Caudoviricetes sp.]
MKIRLAKKIMNTRTDRLAPYWNDRLIDTLVIQIKIDHRVKKAARLISKFNYNKFNKQ